MDADRFDSLARSLTAAGSRRRFLATLSGALALTLAGVSFHEAGAKKKKKKPCPPCKKRKQGKCKKKKPDGTACASGTCQGGTCVAPTCSDGIQNGRETGVDCGGGCQRCATGQGCTSPNDCASAICSGGTCRTCTVGTISDSCGGDADGTCICRQPDGEGSNVCVKNTGTGNSCGSSACPPGEICINNVGSRDCFKPCGAP